MKKHDNRESAEVMTMSGASPREGLAIPRLISMSRKQQTNLKAQQLTGHMLLTVQQALFYEGAVDRELKARVKFFFGDKKEPTAGPIVSARVSVLQQPTAIC